MTCVRSAWLALPGGPSVLLDNPGGGYTCESLDLGSPVVRSVINDRPDGDGAVDRTQYLGPRTVVASINAMLGAGAQIDAVASGFAPFMVPSARPVLHYVLDRPGAAERTLVLRPDAYDWPIVGAVQRLIALQWIAADPIARDPTVHTVTAWSGSGAGSGGRLYNLAYNRTYPSGGGGAPVNATIASPGDVRVRPFFTIYGPITTPQIELLPALSFPSYLISFLPGARIDAGHHVDIDTAARTAYFDSDPTQNWLGQIDWAHSTAWPTLPVSPDSTTLELNGTSTTGATQVVATWQDGYLS